MSGGFSAHMLIMEDLSHSVNEQFLGTQFGLQYPTIPFKIPAHRKTNSQLVKRNSEVNSSSFDTLRYLL